MTSNNDDFDINQIENLKKIPTGEHCLKCGEDLYVVEIGYGGITVPYDCSCKKAEKEAEEKRSEKKFKLKEEERIKSLHDSSGFPPKLKKCYLDNFDLIKGTETAFNAAQRFSDKFPNVRKGILFIGTCGSGKSHLAAAIGNEALNKGYSVKFITAYDLYERIMDTYTSFDKSEYSITSPLKKCCLLIIDDIGTTAPTKRAKAVLHSIIDSRMNSEKPTILTTNLTMKELAEELDSRTIDRIPEGFVTFTITAQSYRKKKG